MTIYSLDVLLFLFGTSLLFHVQFYLLLPDLHTDFSRGRSGGLVFPSLSEFPQFIVTYTVKGFGIVSKAEIDIFLEPSCFFHDPVDVGNLISGSSAFSKTSLNIWNFTVHILLKPGLNILSIILLACAAAKSLQSCPTLCDPIDGSPPGSPVPGTLQAAAIYGVKLDTS